MPSNAVAGTTQVLLLDGAWHEASAMVRHTKDWGRLIKLPLQGESRFWLRSQQGAH